MKTIAVFGFLFLIHAPAGAQTYTRTADLPLMAEPWFLGAPRQVAQDPDGNLYIAHYRGVVKLGPDHSVLRTWSTAPDGLGLAPYAVAASPDGKVLVFDWVLGHVILFDGNGAGLGECCGIATRVQRASLAVDGTGRIFLTGDGRVGVFAADGSRIGYLEDPAKQGAEQVTVDAVGNIYVAGRGGIRKYGPDLVSTDQLGEEVLNAPSGVAVSSSGDVFALAGPQVTKLDAAGNLLAQWLLGPAHADGSLGVPTTSLLIGQGGLLYVTDTDNDRIAVFTTDGTFVKNIGAGGTQPGLFWDPFAVAVAVSPSGSLLVSDGGNDRVQQFDTRGEVVQVWGSAGSDPGEFDDPHGIAVSPSGDVYVADTANHRIQRFDRNGAFVLEWGSEGIEPGQFREPYGIDFNPGGTVLVSDIGHGWIQAFEPDGTYIRRWTGGTFGFTDARGVASDSDGNVYVVDRDGPYVERRRLDGTFVRRWGSSGSEPGRFSAPEGICTDSSGDIYVADTGNRRLQKFGRDGKFLLAIGPFSDYADEMDRVTDCAVRMNGDLYAIDLLRRRVSIFSRRPGTGRLVAAAAHAPGENGTFWRTDISLANIGAADQTCDLRFWSRSQDNANANATPISLPSGTSARIPDVLATTFGLDAAAGSLPVFSETADPLIMSRTYTTAPSGNGTYGQGISAPPATTAIFPGRPGHLVGLEESDRVRTNVGLVSLSELPCTLSMEFFDVRGSPLASTTVTLAPFDVRQARMLRDLGLADRGIVRAELLVSELGCVATAYASIVDERTGDPSFLWVARPEPWSPAGADAVVPVAARARGLAGTLWRTDLVLANLGRETIDVQPRLLEGADLIGGEDSFVLAPGETVTVADVIGRLGRDEAVGLVELGTDGPGLVAWSRTYNETAEGTYGQTIPVEGKFFDSKRPARLIGLDVGPDFRANLGIVNVAYVPVDLLIRFLDSSGAAAAEVPSTIQPTTVRQWTRVADTVGLEPWRVEITTATSGASFLAYLSTVDEVTGDAVYQAAQ